MSNIVHNIKAKLTHHSDRDSNDTANLGNNDTANLGNSATTSATTKDSVRGEDREGEPTYSILPHPAKTNDPADLQPAGSGGLRHGGPMEAYHARDPFVPSEEMKNNLPAPSSREELGIRQQALRPEETPGAGGHGNVPTGIL